MAWLNLCIAVIFEIGWPLGLKFAINSDTKILWITLSIISMTLSGIFLFFAQKEIPIGIAYAIWTGIGMICTFVIGITFFHDILSFIRVLGVSLILTGIVLLTVSVHYNL